VSGNDADIERLVERVAQLLMAREVRLTVAESCTGGLLAKSLTDLPGSSAWFEYGFVVYSNDAKETMLALEPEILRQHGAVSRETCEAMAMSARAISGADIAVAITGIAGPDGGSDDKPVGTVWLAWLGPGRRATCHVKQFAGDRAAVRRQSVIAALNGVLRHLADA
jgi:nicotinamide-nucleotide amidase